MCLMNSMIKNKIKLQAEEEASLDDGDSEEGDGLAALCKQLGHVDAGIVGVGLEAQGLVVPVLHLVAVLEGLRQSLPHSVLPHSSCLLQLPLAPVQLHAAQR